MKIRFGILPALLLAGATFGAVAQQAEAPQPQLWSPVTHEVVQGDIPEIRGIAADHVLPASSWTVNQAELTGLDTLGNAQFNADLLLFGVFGVAVLFALFVMINGKAKLTHGFSGKLVPRWSKTDVTVHWLGAIACMGLILTGLVMAAGRFYLDPLMMEARWQGLVNAMVAWHNFLAFPFIVGALVMMVKWAPKQMPEACDLAWFKSCGGYLNFGSFKGKHPDAGFANAGEKLWFWCFTLFGLILIGTGLVMMFPSLVSTKDAANLALVLHLVGALIVGAFSVVHIFMATIMSEGGMECMVSGQCDENWAKQHHNLWYDKLSRS
ncbi:formate dehydrogenase subunit gamma [Ferrimonas balearica]|uniref:formate dehydrogenase subunit gamma n=1 Tax=Ferrimonas balearica TaxID=44012 RepID=UPI001C94A3D4|nr:formate dehydrogenase subunit gamma [Ferrimonas balearica]MBY6223804.1 formate dehydrogenase subunit gamma [Ferrimonas balearica]